MISDATTNLLFDAVKFLLGTAVGAVIAKRIEGKAELVSHWGHASAFTAKTDTGEQFVIHTHEVVIQNTGRKPATNVRLSHLVLPDQFNVFPSVPYTIETLPDGKKDIVIATVVPKQQITVAYLYYPPLIATGVNAGIRSDEGFAKPVEMELSEKNSAMFNIFAITVFAIGAVSILYWIWRGLTRLGV